MGVDDSEDKKGEESWADCPASYNFERLSLHGLTEDYGPCNSHSCHFVDLAPDS
jgi:hypothetical protein